MQQVFCIRCKVMIRILSSYLLAKLRFISYHLIFQKLGRYNFEIDFIPKIIEKYMSFRIEQKKVSSKGKCLPLIVDFPESL